MLSQKKAPQRTQLQTRPGVCMSYQLTVVANKPVGVQTSTEIRLGCAILKRASALYQERIRQAINITGRCPMLVSRVSLHRRSRYMVRMSLGSRCQLWKYSVGLRTCSNRNQPSFTFQQGIATIFDLLVTTCYNDKENIATAFCKTTTRRCYNHLSAILWVARQIGHRCPLRPSSPRRCLSDPRWHTTVLGKVRRALRWKTWTSKYYFNRRRIYWWQFTLTKSASPTNSKLSNSLNGPYFQFQTMSWIRRQNLWFNVWDLHGMYARWPWIFVLWVRNLLLPSTSTNPLQVNPSQVDCNKHCPGKGGHKTHFAFVLQNLEK